MSRQRKLERSGLLSVDGGQIYWELHGRGDREVLCFLNGVAMSTERWHRSLYRVEDHFDVLLFDYLGQGRSTSEDRPCSVERFGDYPVLIMDELDIDRAHFVGISYGCMVALELGRQHPQRCGCFILSGVPVPSHAPAYAQAYVAQLLTLHNKLSLRDWIRYFYLSLFSEDFIREYRSLLERLLDDFYEQYHWRSGALRRMFEAHDAWTRAMLERLPDYRQIHIPTLVLAGAEDLATPVWEQRELCQIMPNCQLEIVPACGHIMFVERPDVFFSHVVRFAGQHAGRVGARATPTDQPGANAPATAWDVDPWTVEPDPAWGADGDKGGW